tara:strand:+ start:280 stop:834 length:555 start_codon:yes stop_codon:yes gene_type:complete
MANVDAAFGLTPIRHLSGNGYSRANKYTIASGLAENIFTGDAVILIADGVLTPHTATEVNNIGVFAGVSYTASDGSYVYSQYWPSGTVATNIVAYVYDDPYTVFKVQSAGTVAQTNVGNCADLVAGAGSTVSGQSGFEASGTMSNGTATVKILGLYETPDNAMGANAIIEVLINEHLLKDSAGI